MRIYDPDIPNEIARLPEVIDRVGAEVEFDDAIADKRNVFLYQGGGVAICIWSAPRIFECHLLFPPSARGSSAIHACREMGDYMLMFHADMLWGKPSSQDRAAIAHIRRVGFEYSGCGTDPVVGPVEFYTRREIPCLQ